MVKRVELQRVNSKSKETGDGGTVMSQDKIFLGLKKSTYNEIIVL